MASSSIPDPFLSFARAIITNGSKGDMRDFLLTYRKFVSPMQLLSIWQTIVQQLERGESLHHDELQRFVATDSTFDFMKMWLSNYFCDFSPKVRKSFLATLDSLQKHKNRKNQFKLLIIKVTRTPAVSSHENVNSKDGTPQSAPGTPQFSASSTPSISRASSSFSVSPSPAAARNSLFMFPSQEIAQALTFLEFKMFAKVKPIEFISKMGFSRGKNFHGNVTAIINHFNHVSRWVTSQIVTHKGREQLFVLKKMINIAKHCEELNNFNSVMEILSGLNSFPVQRLKRLWKVLSEEHQRKFESLEHLFDTRVNFKNYQEELTKRKQPTLPYLGLFLRDYTFMAENPIYTSEGNVNVELLKLIGSRLEFFQKFQSIPYQALHPSLAAFTYVQNLVIIQDEERLCELSMASEPSESDVSLSEDTAGTASHYDDSNSDISEIDRNELLSSVDSGAVF